MTNDQIAALADGYDQILAKRHVGVECATDKEGKTPLDMLGGTAQSARLTWRADNLAHARWMCGEIKRLCEEEKTNKAMRWLGFVQGILWTMGVFTISELRSHNS